MVEEPDNAVLRMLREMRQRLDKLDNMERTINRVDARVNELYEVATYALGLAASGHVRADTAEAEMNALKARIDRLEAGE